MALSNSIIVRLQTQHLDLRNILTDISAEALHKKQDQSWSIFEHLIHLAVYQPRFIHRLNDIVQNQASVFSAYDTKKDALFEEYRQLEVMDIWDRIQERREDLVSIAETLTEEQLLKTGTHALYGSMTIGDWIDFFLLHEAHHIYRILMLKLEHNPIATQKSVNA
jgi:uncharacterized damage-inducible protein DinB